jgi:hypothetical protein
VPIVLVFEMPGRGEPLNEKEWKKKEELGRNIEKVTKIYYYYKSMMLSWSGENVSRLYRRVVAWSGMG